MGAKSGKAFIVYIKGKWLQCGDQNEESEVEFVIFEKVWGYITLNNGRLALIGNLK
jgi:hypothetical protein